MNILLFGPTWSPKQDPRLALHFYLLAKDTKRKSFCNPTVIYKIHEISTLEPTRADFFMKIGWLLLSKSMTFCQSSRARSGSEAFLIKFYYWSRICSKISSKCLPKPYKIHPRSDPEPYQEIDDVLEGIARKSTIPLHWILSEKGEEMERDCLKPVSYTHLTLPTKA